MVLVKKVWNDPSFLSEGSRQHRFFLKLKELKNQTKSWHKEHQARKKALLVSLKSDISETLNLLVADPNNLALTSTLRLLEQDRNGILQEEEEQWRLRSRALWMTSGDKNSKYFHKIASQNRIKKHIWEIKRQNGELISGQENIKEEAVNFFKGFYKADFKHFTTEHFKLIDSYQQMVSAEEAASLFAPVNLAELKEVLLHFKK